MGYTLTFNFWSLRGGITLVTLDWGSRGRQFKSGRSDTVNKLINPSIFRGVFLLYDIYSYLLNLNQ
jgi:hypothetical protein